MAMPEEIEDEGPAASEVQAPLALIGDNLREPAADLPDSEGLANWSAATALWHPAILARVDSLPRLEGLESPTAPGPGEVRVLAAALEGRLPSGYRVQAEDLGATLIEGDLDRIETAAAVLGRLRAGRPAARERRGRIAARARLPRPGHGPLVAPRPDRGDGPSRPPRPRRPDPRGPRRRECLEARATGRRRPAASGAAFEMLTQARERFYPVDASIVDLCLLDPTTRADALDATLADRVPTSIVATARAIESLAGRRPDAIEAIRQAVTEGWLDVVGGTFEETDEPLRPFESIAWQFRKGGEVYRRHLDERNVETLARRRFGLYPMLPQVARRFGLRFGLHLGFDAGGFPVQAEAKKMWEAPDGSSLEALNPAASRRRSGLERPHAPLAAGPVPEGRPRRHPPPAPLGPTRSPAGISTSGGSPPTRPSWPAG